jgi:peptidoglycan/LPS O-acetylase OafA/YrhL
VLIAKDRERPIWPTPWSVGAAKYNMPAGAYRFLLALIVFFSHTRFNVFDFTNASTGFVAVICFFVVSGFIIARVLDTVYVGHVWHFVINRMLRIYPVMWAATIISLAAIAVHGNFTMWPATISGWTLDDAIRSFSLIAAFPYRVWKVVPPGWTIHIEACFYVAIVIGYAAVGRLSERSKSSAIRSYCLIWLAIYLMISCATNLRFENAAGFIPFFVLGVAIHRLTFGLSSRAEWMVFGFAFALSLNSILHWNNVENLSIFTPWTDIQPWFATVRIPGNLVWFTIMLAVFVALLYVNIPVKLRRIDGFLGDLTYPMYATHFIVCAVTGDGFMLERPALITMIQLVACLIVAYLFNRWIERPLYPLRDAFRGKGKAFSGLLPSYDITAPTRIQSRLSF